MIKQINIQILTDGKSGHVLYIVFNLNASVSLCRNIEVVMGEGVGGGREGGTFLLLNMSIRPIHSFVSFMCTVGGKWCTYIILYRLTHIVSAHLQG